MFCFVFHKYQLLDPYICKHQAGIEKNSKWDGQYYCDILTCILAYGRKPQKENNATLELSGMGKPLYSEIK